MREQICKMNPEKRGHDACGIGAVVDRWGRPSRRTVEDALEIVEHLEHRAGKDASGQTGDGVGILLQICHPFFVAAAKEVGVDLAQAAPAPSSGRCRRSCSRQRRAARARESWPAWSIRPRAAVVGGRASAGSQARGTWQRASARINCSRAPSACHSCRSRGVRKGWASSRVQCWKRLQQITFRELAIRWACLAATFRSGWRHWRM